MAKQRNEKGQFVKGSVGNPKGRPSLAREVKYYDILKSLVAESDWAEIIQTAIKQAKRGDNVARKWLSDYLIGAPVQKTELSGSDGSALEIIVKYADTPNSSEAA